MAVLFKYVDVGYVRSFITDNVAPIGDVEKVGLDKAYGRVVAVDVRVNEDVPPRELSHVDGFAVRVEDIGRVPARLRLSKGSSLGAGEAVPVRTGWPVPSGSNAVIPVESVRIDGGFVKVFYKPPRMYEVIPKGIDFRRGEVVVSRGAELMAQDVMVIASLGYEAVDVVRRPVVTVIPTGTEYVEGGGREFTSYLVCSVLRAYGALCRREQPVPDDVGLIARAVDEALRASDAVATLGGASIGNTDFTWRAVTSLRPAKYFRGVKMQPGKVTSAAIVKGKPVVLLPGLPESAFAGLTYVLLPVVRRLLGLPMDPKIRLGYGVIGRDSYVGGKYLPFMRTRFVKGVGEGDEGMPVVEVIESISYMVSPMLRSLGFIEIPPHAGLLRRGEVVALYGIRGFLRV